MPLYGKAVARSTSRLRLRMFQAMTKQEIGFFDSKANSPGSPCNRLASVEQVPHLVTDIYGELARASFTAIYGLGLSFAFSPLLTVILLSLAPYILAVGYWQSISSSNFAETSKEANEQSTQVAMEAIREVKTLKMLNRETFAVKRYDAFLVKPYSLTIRNAARDSLAYATQATAAMFTIALGFYAGQKLSDAGKIELWQVMAVVLGMMTTMLSIADSARFGTS
ncbi:ABC transporter B member 11 [Geranomyces variabilis]|nr:ABC transporter B member 11 [Geranomyces variabilis]